VLQTEHNKSLATTIELSLTSPMFQELGPDARGLLEVIVFFPQGVYEDNLNWLFPTISDGTNIHCKKNYALNSVIIDLNYNFSNPPSEMRHQST